MHSSRLLVGVGIDGLTALFALLWIYTLVARRRRGAPLGGSVRATLWAVVISFTLAHVNRWFDLWPAHPYFPSGHETLAACLATAAALEDRRLALLAFPLLALLGYALVRSGWHDRMEVVAGFLLGALVMAIAARIAYRARTESSQR
ncbi:MAG TPA: phosphatase PAP2 family protein [Candidatus Tyrphobacter sp.]